PTHVEVVICGKPCSAKVGTSGYIAMRLAELIASTRTLPALICGTLVVIGSNIEGMAPASMSCSDGAEPLYGTCFSLTPARPESCSPIRWVLEPMPELPTAISAG